MHRSTAGLMFSVILLATTCAHKAPPIAKDRLKPRLSKASAINNRQVQLTFSEPIDTAALVPGNVAIAADRDTLDIILLYPSLSPAEIVVVTAPMRDIPYTITGRVLDKAGNEGTFTRRIQGSTVADTIAPWVIEHAAGKTRNEFTLGFSEAMDTTWFAFSVLPEKNFTPAWLDLRRARFVPAAESESLATGTKYYFHLDHARDLSGNRARPFITAITPDTTARPVALRGRALHGDASVAHAIALLRRTQVVDATLVTAGNFTFMVQDSLPYEVIVISDGLSGKDRVDAASANVIRLSEERLDIDSLFY